MNDNTQHGLILVDAHVHIHDCFNLGTLLSSAYENFRIEALRRKAADEFTGVLILTETSKHNWFSRLSACADAGTALADETGGGWHFFHTNEVCSLLARSGGGRHLILLAGRQIVTEEKLEVLALATRRNFQDGTPVRDLILAINECGAIPVLPWGVGKWLGRRGQILQSLLTSSDRPEFFLGDNGGRPIFWPRPAMFQVAERLGMRVLPGSDPLPLPLEELRCGSFGFAIEGVVSEERPHADIKRLIEDSTAEILSFGNLEKPLRFIRNQLQLRLQPQ